MEITYGDDTITVQNDCAKVFHCYNNVTAIVSNYQVAFFGDRDLKTVIDCLCLHEKEINNNDIDWDVDKSKYTYGYQVGGSYVYIEKNNYEHILYYHKDRENTHLHLFAAYNSNILSSEAVYLIGALIKLYNILGRRRQNENRKQL